MGSKIAKARYYAKNKALVKARAKAYNLKHGKEAWHLKQRSYMLKRRYGMTHEDYERMFEAQAGKCGICKRVKKDVPKRYLDIDHCHQSGKVRGLLCGACNKMLAVLENAEWLLKAKQYLSGVEYDPKN